MKTRSNVVVFLLAIVVLFSMTACDDAKQPAFMGAKVRSVVLSGDNGDLVRNALMEKMIHEGAVRASDKDVDVIDLVGEVKWQGTGDDPQSLVVKLVSTTQSKYTLSVSDQVTQETPGVRAMTFNGDGPINDMSFAKVIANRITWKMAAQYRTQVPHPTPQSGTARQPGS